MLKCVRLRIYMTWSSRTTLNRIFSTCHCSSQPGRSQSRENANLTKLRQSCMRMCVLASVRVCLTVWRVAPVVALGAYLLWDHLLTHTDTDSCRGHKHDADIKRYLRNGVHKSSNATILPDFESQMPMGFTKRSMQAEIRNVSAAKIRPIMYAFFSSVAWKMCPKSTHFECSTVFHDMSSIGARVVERISHSPRNMESLSWLSPVIRHAHRYSFFTWTFLNWFGNGS